MGVGTDLYMYDVVVKSSRSLSHLLISSCSWTSTDGQGTKWRRKIDENFNRLSRAHKRYRQQTTDGRATAYSEREREFTFTKKSLAAVPSWDSRSKIQYLNRWLSIALTCITGGECSRCRQG